MKIYKLKECLAEIFGCSAIIKASKGHLLVVDATDCEVETKLDKVIIRSKSVSVKEIKEK